MSAETFVGPDDTRFWWGNGFVLIHAPGTSNPDTEVSIADVLAFADLIRAEGAK